MADKGVSKISTDWLNSLLGIVAHETAHQTVRVDTFRRRAARLRIAVSISSSVARFGVGASKP
jgi:hypothetical protein